MSHPHGPASGEDPAAMAAPPAAPAGFAPTSRTGPFFDLIGPVYERRDAAAVSLGLRVQHKHLNARQRVHAAVLTALLDVTMGRQVAAGGGGEVRAVTATLTVQFLSAASLDDWLETRARVARLGRRLAYVEGIVSSGERDIATASAVFAVGDVAG